MDERMKAEVHKERMRLRVSRRYTRTTRMVPKSYHGGILQNR